MGSTEFTARHQSVVNRAGFFAPSYSYSDGAQIIAEIVDYFDAAGTAGGPRANAVKHATEQSFATLAAIIDELRASHLQVSGSGSAYRVLQETVGNIVDRLAEAHRGLLAFEEEIGPSTDAPSVEADGEDAPHVP